MKIKQSTEQLLSYFLTENEQSQKSQEELVELYKIEREPLIQGMINFRKQQQGEMNWRKHRWKYMKGIKQFHKSTEGKTFHRALGRFLSQRILPERTSVRDMLFPDKRETLLTTRTLMKESFPDEKYTTLTALSSLKTHLYIEGNYCYPLISESIEVASLLEYAIPLLNTLEQKIFMNTYETITEDEIELLLRLVDRTVLLRECAEYMNISFDACKQKYINIFENMKKQYSTSEEYFIYRVIGNL